MRAELSLFSSMLGLILPCLLGAGLEAAHSYGTASFAVGHRDIYSVLVEGPPRASRALRAARAGVHVLIFRHPNASRDAAATESTMSVC